MLHTLKCYHILSCKVLWWLVPINGCGLASKSHPRRFSITNGDATREDARISTEGYSISKNKIESIVLVLDNPRVSKCQVSVLAVGAIVVGVTTYFLH